MQGLTFPLLENANEYIVHGFAYNDYLKEVEPPTAIGRVGASLDKAFASECGRATITMSCFLHSQARDHKQLLSCRCCRCCMCVRVCLLRLLTPLCLFASACRRHLPECA